MPATKFRIRKPEAFLITRLRAQMTQDYAAGLCGVPVKTYGQWERGLVAIPNTVHSTKLRPSRAPLGKLTPSERCILLRRRAEMTQAQVAEAVGCSRWWVNQMEGGNAPAKALVEFWRCRTKK